MIYAISGFPGVGKTTLRKTDPKLKNLPHLDVADFYRKYPGIHSNDAFALLLGEMDTLIEQGKDVVVEATFFTNSIQRVWLGLHAGMHGVELKYIDLHADPQICYDRIKAQYEEDIKTADPKDRGSLEEYYQSRFRLLQDFSVNMLR